MEIHYLGPTKTFSEQAAALFTGGQADVAFVPEPSFEEISRAVAADARAQGVLPYYNFLEGLIQESLDLVYEYDVRIAGRCRVPIEFALGGEGDGPVYSHPKALAQCTEFIQQHLPRAERILTSSTADAARQVKETGRGWAIANPAALEEFGLPIRHRDIGNRKHGRGNFTDFLLIVNKQVERSPAAQSPRTILAVTPWGDRIGLLADILNCFHFFGLNLAKIHSRPAIDAVETDVEPQMFYLELFCGESDERFERCLDTLRFRFHQVEGSGIYLKVLGSFCVPEDQAGD